MVQIALTLDHENPTKSNTKVMVIDFIKLANDIIGALMPPLAWNMIVLFGRHGANRGDIPKALPKKLSGRITD